MEIYEEEEEEIYVSAILTGTNKVSGFLFYDLPWLKLYSTVLYSSSFVVFTRSKIWLRALQTAVQGCCFEAD